MIRAARANARPPNLHYQQRDEMNCIKPKPNAFQNPLSSPPIWMKSKKKQKTKKNRDRQIHLILAKTTSSTNSNCDSFENKIVALEVVRSGRLVIQPHICMTELLLSCCPYYQWPDASSNITALVQKALWHQHCPNRVDHIGWVTPPALWELPICIFSLQLVTTVMSQWLH